MQFSISPYNKSEGALIKILFLAFALIHPLYSSCLLELQKRQRAESVAKSEPSEYLESQGAKFNSAPIWVDGENLYEYSVFAQSNGEELSNIRILVQNPNTPRDTKNDYAEVKWMNTRPFARDRYFGTAIVLQMARDFPHVKSVGGDMILDNKSEYRRVLRETGSIEAAVKATPFYKIMSSAGYSKIDYERSFLKDNYRDHLRIVLKK